jgi:hypothetical protein
MVDNNYELLYYRVIGKLYNKHEKKNGGFNNEEKNRGIRLLTKYREKY